MSEELRPENSSENIDEKRHTLAEALGINPQDIEDASDVVGKQYRYEYYFASLPNGEQAFIKKAGTPELNDALAREALATQIAHTLGIPSKEVYQVGTEPNAPIYREQDGRGIIALEALDSEKWRFLATPEQLAGLEVEDIQSIAAVVAHNVRHFSGREVPADIDTSIFRSGKTADWRYRSPEHVDKVWDEAQVVIEKANTIFPNNAEAVIRLAELMNDAKQRIAYVSTRMGDVSTEKEYFAHGDFDPYNIALSQNPDSTKYNSLVLDFESAGKTTYQALAKLADLSNFFGRCWPNPELQKAIIHQSFEQEITELSVEDAYHLLRSSIIFGSFYLAKYAMDPEHVEHTMARSLLLSLEDNLASLDMQYTQHIESPQV